MADIAIRPSRKWYLLACVLVLGGLTPFALTVVSLVRKFVRDPQQVVVPGKGTVTLAKPGPYTILYEHTTTVDGTHVVTPAAMPPLECKLVEEASGQKVKLSPLRGKLTYETPQRKAEGVWNFTVRHPGKYELSAAYPPGASGPAKLVLSVTSGNLLGTILGTCGTGVLAVLCALAGAVVFVVVLAKRIACRKRAVQGTPG